jgi:hypothetical protein
MQRRIAAIFAALVMTLGLGATFAGPAVAAPVAQAVALTQAEITQAQIAAEPKVCHYVLNDDDTIASKTCPAEKASVNRWGYCSPNWYNGKIWFWDLQGYCGSSVAMNYPAGNQCRYMGNWDNWAGSSYNLSTQDLYLWNAGGCTGLSGYVYLLNGSAIPDMYSIQLGNAVSSISQVSTGCPEC